LCNGFGVSFSKFPFEILVCSCFAATCNLAQVILRSHFGFAFQLALKCSLNVDRDTGTAASGGVKVSPFFTSKQKLQLGELLCSWNSQKFDAVRAGKGFLVRGKLLQ
jgi:hypothetical protein